MEPALHSGQLVRLHRGLPQQLPRGTIVVVSRFPEPPSIKRIVGLPQETVSFQAGEVFINGRMLRENYLPACQTTFSWNHEQLTTQNDEYVLLGDNRLTSLDSRDYGVVKRSKIIACIEGPSAPAQLLPHPYYRLTKDGHQPGNSCTDKTARKVNGAMPPPLTSRLNVEPRKREDDLTKG